MGGEAGESTKTLFENVIITNILYAIFIIVPKELKDSGMPDL